MAWKIKMQTVKVHGVEVEVAAKWVTRWFRPQEQKGRKIVPKGFGKAKTPTIRVEIECDGEVHTISWSNYYNQPLSGKSPGKFTYKWPKKLGFQTYTVGQGRRRRVVQDTISPMKLVNGPEREFECHELFWEWLAKERGAELAQAVQAAFAACLAQAAMDKAA